MHRTHAGVVFCCLVPLEGGRQVLAFIEEIVVNPLMQPPLQSTFGLDASKNG